MKKTFALLTAVLTLSGSIAFADYDDQRALQLPVALGDSAEALPLAPSTSARPYAAGTPQRPRVTLKAPEYADAATTALGLARGAVEGNPLFAWSGSAAPIVGLAGKYAVKRLLVANGYTVAQADYNLGITSTLAACSNLAVITSGATLGAGLTVGAVCAGVYAYVKAKPKGEVLVAVGS
jgi:hypothetical protein